MTTKESSYPFADGSIYCWRIRENENGEMIYEDRLLHPRDDDTPEKFRLRSREAFVFFLKTGQMTKEEFDKYVNYDNFFNDFSY